MRTLNWYIAKRVLIAIFAAFLIITSIIMLVDFVETSRDLGSDTDASMLTILYITFLNAPLLVEQTIPFVVLFGVMGALYALNRRSELIVMRAAGLSAWRFLMPAIILTGLLGVAWATAFNPIAAMSQNKYDQVVRNLSDSETSPRASTTEQNPIWLREGNDDGYIVIHAKSSDIDAHILYDVTFYTYDFTSDGKPIFSTRFDATKAKLHKDGFWVLSDVIENEDNKAPQSFKTISKATTISWETLKTRSQAKSKPPFWQIRGEIAKAKKSGFDPTSLVLRFHKLLALPLSLIAMAIIAACATLNTARAGNTLRILIAGGVLGFGVYFIDNLISAFGATGVLPPIVAAWTVPFLVLAMGMVVLMWIEDG